MAAATEARAADALDEVMRTLFVAEARVPPSEAVVAPDVVFGSMHVPVPPLNAAFGARFDTGSADRRIDEVVAWFAARSMPCLWWVGPGDRPLDLASRLARHGFLSDDETVPGMIRDLDDLPVEPLPAGVTVDRVRDEAMYAEACGVVGVGFRLPPEVGEAFARLAVLGFGDDLPVRTFLARDGGRPVATSLAVLADDVAGLFNIATVPEARGRGLGRAVTLAALRDARAAGCRLAVLQSSEMGRGVYEKLGFRVFADYRVLVWPGPLDEGARPTS